MVKYNLQDLATVSGKGGLFKVIKPTRSGVIIESLDKDKKRMMIQTRHKISLLQEISIFTVDEEGSLALDKVLASIYTKHGNKLTVTSESSETELRKFIEDVLPTYDEERVYSSDIKKLISWYSIINEFSAPIVEEDKPKKAAVKKEPTDEKKKSSTAEKKKETAKKPKAEKASK